MRTYKCAKCGKLFDREGESESRLCPECVAQVRREAVLHLKECTRCGKSYVGYPKSMYCDDCRIIVQREREKRSKERKKAGKTRKIGSIDHCKNCGKEYIVNGAMQVYCPECAKVVVAEKIKKSKREYANAHKAERKERREERRQNTKVCQICGKPFTSTQPTATCSPECAREAERRKQARADVARGKASPERILGKMERTNPQSGIPGITWHKKTGKWQLVVNGKYAGLYETLEAAKSAKAKKEGVGC